MSLYRAIREVIQGHCQRIAVPGGFKVWRDGDLIHVEVLR